MASLKVEDATKLEASAGDKTGIPWPDSLGRPKVGMPVYVASSSAANAAAAASPTARRLTS